MMSPRNELCPAYALTDTAPDEELQPRRADYNQEKIMNVKFGESPRRTVQWYVIDENVQAMNLNASVTNQPIRKLRFFRESLGTRNLGMFLKMMLVLVQGAEQAVSRLIDEADMLVEYILEKDERVLRNSSRLINSTFILQVITVR